MKLLGAYGCAREELIGGTPPRQCRGGWGEVDRSRLIRRFAHRGFIQAQEIVFHSKHGR